MALFHLRFLWEEKFSSFSFGVKKRSVGFSGPDLLLDSGSKTCHVEWARTNQDLRDYFIFSERLTERLS